MLRILNISNVHDNYNYEEKKRQYIVFFLKFAHFFIEYFVIEKNIVNL
jgi:hypothetical protein